MLEGATFAVICVPHGEPPHSFRVPKPIGIAHDPGLDDSICKHAAYLLTYTVGRECVVSKQ